MSETKKEEVKSSPPPVKPANQTPQGAPARMSGQDVEAATMRVGGDPAGDLLKNAIANLEQRTVDRLPEDQRKGSKAEFEAFRETIAAIYGPSE